MELHRAIHGNEQDSFRLNSSLGPQGASLHQTCCQGVNAEAWVRKCLNLKIA